MSQGLTEDFTIAVAGTVSDGLHNPGYRLVGLILPTMDTTVIGFSVSADGGSTWHIVFLATHTGTPVALNMGVAQTTAKAQAVPLDVSKMSIACQVRLNVAAQDPAVTIIGIWEKVA